MGTRTLAIAVLTISLFGGGCAGSGQEDADTPPATSEPEPDSVVGVGDPPPAPVTVSVTEHIPYMTGSQRSGPAADILPADELTVMDRFLPVGDGPWPVVVLLHGGTMRAEGMWSTAWAIAERGANVYTPTFLHWLWDLRSEHVASGFWAGETLLGDLSCAIRAARADAIDHGGAPEHLTLVGYSMGAGFGATVTLVGDDSDLAAGTSGSCVVSGGSVMPDWRCSFVRVWKETKQRWLA